MDILRDITGRWLLIDQDKDEVLGNFPTREEAEQNKRWIRDAEAREHNAKVERETIAALESELAEVRHNYKALWHVAQSYANGNASPVLARELLAVLPKPADWWK